MADMLSTQGKYPVHVLRRWLHGFVEKCHARWILSELEINWEILAATSQNTLSDKMPFIIFH